jgi:TRAP-type C4-dicarboxylate transport system permease small subunit
MQRVLKWIRILSDNMRYAGAAALTGMMALTCVDVVGRFFRRPIFGSVELVTFMGVFVVAFALPFTHDNKGHIGVEILMLRLSGKTRAAIDLITETVGFVFFSLVAWRMFIYGGRMRASGEVSMNLELPEYLLVYLIACCFAVFCVTILKRIVETIDILRTGEK